MDTGRRSGRLLGAGVATGVAGLVALVVVVLQPWATCPDETASAGCPAGTAETAGMLVAVLVLGVGALMAIWGVTGGPRRRRS